MTSHPLIRALARLFPDAAFHIFGARDWCSVTFSGQLLTIHCNPANTELLEYYGRLSAILAEHEFSLPGLLVADISVIMPQNSKSPIIEALVINE